MPVRVVSVSIRDFGCIGYRMIEIGPDGVEIKGPSGTGKTSIGDAIETTLVGKGISKKCIRRGADRSEVMVHCDASPDPAFTVRRTIPAEGQTKVVVKNDKGDTRPWQDAAGKVAAIFGTMFDPSRFLTVPPAEQVAMVAGLYPMPLAADDLKRWTGEDLQPEEGRNGLEIIDAHRARYYKQRTDAKKAAKEAVDAYRTAMDVAEGLAKPEYVGVVVGLLGEEDAPVRAAEKAQEGLAQRRRQAEEMAKRTEGTRSRIAALIAEAAAIRAAGPMIPPLSEVELAAAALASADAEVKDLEQRLEKARNVVEAEKAIVNKLAKQQDDANDATKREAQKRQQARDLEATLAEATIETPSLEEWADAEQEIVRSRAHADLVRGARAYHDAQVKAAALADEVTAAQKEVDRLEGIVERLTKDAPAEMVARAKAIPGLAIVEGEIYLDGVAFSRCGGAERRHFAVELAKRANPDGKLIKMDEVGSMDDKTRVAMYEEIIRDGFAVIALRPWCDPERDIAEPVVVPIREAIEEVKQLNPNRRVKVKLDGKDIA